MSRIGLGMSNCRPVQSVVGGVVQAERLGAEIAFVAEDVNCREAFQMLAVSARATERIRLATGVVNPFTRNPTALAMAIATLDEISGGRATLGLGTSSPSLIRGQMGIPSSGSVTVMREATEIVRALLAGDSVSYEGERFRYRDAHLEAIPVQEHIPIFYAAMGPRMLHLAGQLADGVLLNVGASLEYVRWAIRQIRDGAAQAGRSADSITIAAWMSVYVGDSEENLLRARRWLAGVLSVPRQGELLLQHGEEDPAILPRIRRLFQAYPDRGDRAAAGHLVSPELVRRLAVIGTLEEVRARIQQYREAGVDLPVVGLATLQALQ